ncbi:hypothetical protein HanIR_Chr10g0452841 [Helianthus annuus]|nr:hypothetical protein HanIR_Chr10g0452841 [Helianthus annuus]
MLPYPPILPHPHNILGLKKHAQAQSDPRRKEVRLVRHKASSVQKASFFGKKIPLRRALLVQEFFGH